MKGIYFFLKPFQSAFKTKPATTYTVKSTKMGISFANTPPNSFFPILVKSPIKNAFMEYLPGKHYRLYCILYHKMQIYTIKY